MKAVERQLELYGLPRQHNTYGSGDLSDQLLDDLGFQFTGWSQDPCPVHHNNFINIYIICIIYFHLIITNKCNLCKLTC